MINHNDYIDRPASLASERAAKDRVKSVRDTTKQRLAEMEAQDPHPNDGVIEVGKLKESK